LTLSPPAATWWVKPTNTPTNEDSQGMDLPEWLTWLPDRLGGRPAVTVIRLNGVIGGIGPWRQGMTLAALAPTLERAFRRRRTAAVALVINSPGGSAVQTALIARRIRALADEHAVPVVAFAEEIAASGGYWLATAADEIHADAASVIGSIGVVFGGFGFPELLKRWGVERRLYTAGERKAALDPFRPEQADEVEHVQGFLADVHRLFQAQVRERRAGKLQGAEDELFSGRWWSGERALALGLIDGLGDVRTVMRRRFGDDVRFRVIADGRPWWRRRFARLGGAPATGGDADWTGRMLAAVEERLMWSRFGM
jgi:signal peptide peptidase SppA